MSQQNNELELDKLKIKKCMELNNVSLLIGAGASFHLGLPTVSSIPDDLHEIIKEEKFSGIYKEAQHYIPEKTPSDKDSVSKKVFERIAREGRKYGISLIVSSQRPSELSKTVLSQCNSFIVHRLQNPDDQKYVKQVVSSASNDVLDQIQVLPQQHAIIMGDCVRTPIQVKINEASPAPNSNNPKFIEHWKKDSNGIDYNNYNDAIDKLVGLKDKNNKKTQSESPLQSKEKEYEHSNNLQHVH